MRFFALAASVFALSASASAQIQSSFDLGALSASAAALASHFKTENPTQLLSSINGEATQALATLHSLAATATGSYGSALRSEYSHLAGQLSTAQASASKALADNPTGAVAGGGSSADFAAATAVPIVAVGIGMAVVGFL